VSVALFAYKGLWLTVVLYAVFIVLSFAGWRQWKRRLA
jgi:nicotinamide mononucleotide transporter